MPAKPKRRKYVVTLSIETPEKLTKAEVKARIKNDLTDAFGYFDAKVRIRTVDMD